MQRSDRVLLSLGAKKVLAFPTLRWYHAGEPVAPDYKMDRTVDALMGFANRKLDMDDKFKEWATKNAESVTPEDKEAKRKLYHQDRPELCLQPAGGTGRRADRFGDLQDCPVAVARSGG